MTNQELLSRTWRSLHKFLVEKRGMTPQDANAEILEHMQKTCPPERLGFGYGGSISDQIKVLKMVRKIHQIDKNH